MPSDKGLRGLPGGSVAKNPPANSEDLGSISGWGRSPGEGNGNTLQYSCLGNPIDRGTRRATVHGISKSGQVSMRVARGSASWHREPRSPELPAPVPDGECPPCPWGWRRGCAAPGPQPILPANPAGSELGRWWAGLQEGRTAVPGAGRGGTQSEQGLPASLCPAETLGGCTPHAHPSASPGRLMALPVQEAQEGCMENPRALSPLSPWEQQSIGWI